MFGHNQQEYSVCGEDAIDLLLQTNAGPTEKAVNKKLSDEVKEKGIPYFSH
ncbi:MAG: hypothetical protein HDT39_14920 [Lachnospiraceae bacterium]|nr:hypothetical protein [Lachnospiraceae bacterium]